MRAFEKTIEIYDGNWCSHWVCPFGMFVLVIGQIISVIGLFVVPIIQASHGIDPSLTLVLGLAIGGLALFFIGSCIGKETPHGRH